MTFKKCILTANDCYKQRDKMTNGKPTGIVVHSTGANNPTIKRYVQPLKSDSDYNSIITDLGINTNGNHWNQTGINKCVHAFIGKTASGNISTYQTLPFDYCCWGCGSGSKGSYNKNPTARIQFEICEDDLKDIKYFNTVYTEAVEFCAYICKTYNLSVSNIVSHAESYKAGYATNHGDIDHWFKVFNKTMNDFRAAVSAELNKNTTTIDTSSDYAYGVYKITQVSSLNMRKGPGTEYDIIKALPKNTLLNVSKIENKSWGYMSDLGGWCNISNSYCTKTTVSKEIIYTVAKGDTLTKIAKKYNSTIKNLTDYNNIKDADKIIVGQKIKIPQ